MRLDSRDQWMLSGDAGEGTALAMRVLTGVAEAMGAEELVDVVSAHVDGCLFHGQVSLDFARALLEGGAAAVVPTTLNVGSLDLLHPDLVRVDADTRRSAGDLMDLYVDLGCRPTWTCAPYQLSQRPRAGDQVAWAESNAIVFANSVLGARTERYGDFLDICAAVTGRAPRVGLHLDEGRRARVIIDVGGLGDLLEEEATYPLLGILLGELAGTEVAAIVGLPSGTDEDRLKALGSAAASSGAVAMFHAVGLTPEAPDLDTATGGGRGLREVVVDIGMIRGAHRRLTSAASDRVDAVCLGTPHYSATQFRRLSSLLAGQRCKIPTYVNTGRDVLASLDREVVDRLEEAGVQVVTDTCTYIAPIIDPEAAVVMTDSAKWAHYAPANLGVDVLFGSMSACVDAALSGMAGEPW